MEDKTVVFNYEMALAALCDERRVTARKRKPEPSAFEWFDENSFLAALNSAEQALRSAVKSKMDAYNISLFPDAFTAQNARGGLAVFPPSEVKRVHQILIEFQVRFPGIEAVMGIAKLVPIRYDGTWYYGFDESKTLAGINFETLNFSIITEFISSMTSLLRNISNKYL